MNRRELLTAFLGATVAASACRRTPRAGPVPGEIVDRALELGHRLRGPPLPRASTFRELEVLIVGAGVSGLSAGWRLAAAGVNDFQILELDQAEGGTSRAGASEVTAYPWGAHYLPAPLTTRGPVPRLLGEMGLWSQPDEHGAPVIAEEALIRTPEERLFYRGRWYEGLYLHAGASAEDLAQLSRFEERMAGFAAARDSQGRRAFAVPAATSSDDAEWTALDRLSMAQWLEQEQLHSERLRWLVDYACRDDFGARAAHVSAWAGIWYFASRQDGKGRRSEGFLSWPEGNGRLVRHLAQAVGRGRLSPSVLVHAIEPGPDSVTVHAWQGGAPVGFRARQVILAVPRFVASRLVPGLPASTAFTYSPWVVANLHLSRPPRSRGFPLAWDNVFYESDSLGYVVATHQATRADDSGPTVLTWYYPMAGGEVGAERSRALSLGYPEWEQLVMSDLRRGHPELAATRLEIWRWGHAMIRPTPGFIWGPERRAPSPHPRLQLAHSDLSGVAIFEDANHQGVAAAERVLGPRTESWL